MTTHLNTNITKILTRKHIQKSHNFPMMNYEIFVNFLTHLNANIIIKNDLIPQAEPQASLIPLHGRVTANITYPIKISRKSAAHTSYRGTRFPEVIEFTGNGTFERGRGRARAHFDASLNGKHRVQSKDAS